MLARSDVIASMCRALGRAAMPPLLEALDASCAAGPGLALGFWSLRRNGRVFS